MYLSSAKEFTWCMHHYGNFIVKVEKVYILDLNSNELLSIKPNRSLQLIEIKREMIPYSIYTREIYNLLWLKKSIQPNERKCSIYFNSKC